ncbi:MAG: hypothetical protein M3N53_13080 [Actinomycetota bacterium]|nr:hypothetical protein [Actinomycetota bacterium]
MPMNFRTWEEPDPAELLLLFDDKGWENLFDRYAGELDQNIPLKRCLDVARAAGATSVVIETRYMDLDYRSEYSAFYSRTFEFIPDSAHRLHFFSIPLAKQQIWSLPHDIEYLGFMVIRPSELGPVCRTLLRPPPGLEGATRTEVKATANLFGQDLSVRAVPFVQQDTRLGRCAHAAAWMCHYMGYLRGDVARRTMADFSLLAEPALGMGRPLPSEGLTDRQLVELFRQFDLPCKVYSVHDLPETPDVPWTDPDPQPPAGDPPPHPGTWDTRLIRISCRYLNSGYPVLVATKNHTFVLCGYERERRAGQRDWITFLRHDDQRGPYLRINDVTKDVDPGTGDVLGPWEKLIVPLPEKLWMSPENAEIAGGRALLEMAQHVRKGIPDAAEVFELLATKRFALRTYARPANIFKRELEGRVDEVVLRELRLARFSRYVWVVELVDRARRERGEPCVVGEAVIDSTSSDDHPQALAVHVPGAVWVSLTDGESRGPSRCGPDPYQSGGVGPP